MRRALVAVIAAADVGVRFVLAINGTDLRAPTDPDALLQTADSDTTVDLTLAASPTGPSRHVAVKPVSAEISLREAA